MTNSCCDRGLVEDDIDDILSTRLYIVEFKETNVFNPNNLTRSNCLITGITSGVTKKFITIATIVINKVERGVCPIPICGSTDRVDRN